MKLTPKQERFVEEYIKTGNAAEAARRAGYNRGTSRDAASWLNPSKPRKFKPYLAQIIEQRKQELQAKNGIATAEDVMKFFTQVMNDEITEKVVINQGTGIGFTKPLIVEKPVAMKQRIEAGKEILKRNALELELTEKKLIIEKLKAEIEEKKAGAQAETMVFTFSREEQGDGS